jgi:hypothetical protein
VVGGIADEMDERVRQPLDHRLVELGGLARRHQLDLLAGIAGQVVDQPAEPGKQLDDRHHADGHHAVPKLGGEMLDLLGDRAQVHVVAAAGDLLEPGLGDHEFADAVHKLVQPERRNPDGGIRAHGPAIDLDGGRRSGPRCLGAHRPGHRQHRDRHARGGYGDRRPGARRPRERRYLSRRLGAGRTARHRLDLQRHLVEHEQEHVLDRGARFRGREQDVPAEVA